MKQRKYALQDWIRQSALAYCRGYKRMKEEILAEEKEILYATHAHTERSLENGQEQFVMQPKARGGKSDPTAERACALQALWDSPKGQAVLAVDHALFVVVYDIAPEEQRNALSLGLLANCENGRKSPYERIPGIPVSRSDFYRR